MCYFLIFTNDSGHTCPYNFVALRLRLSCRAGIQWIAPSHGYSAFRQRIMGNSICLIIVLRSINPRLRYRIIVVIRNVFSVGRLRFESQRWKAVASFTRT